ncbi:hypothetical protein PHYBLDRAFT_165266 [Phycomyces blakesleeanus NRRL 1555(-)]|uniref:Uncharacterized protein n=1 Tax=Phycomyces blakesleeanus (strain ATCC 8743b / DSM 1359 / FGSC 10004 / NBRC 33097 / NRRL 1555) TaxID=763407 RepID=A0A167NWJ2_PHYB8|nr:hypothetical protein PHYBLDRAFT_165266 [Phycomyces blakesleeanus NRRL 1555(-)]OAD76754.1 hypothetical protein PHYBLDRAFT_165266 [Phycomyces blakesleeanus NRRL 1555(-)]|eukprot:XP_018294794.1 hypothetical protein PHYBLDRAFT_165266 [Phycomyces blakesleeanus NRRL 1555(-)]
MDSAPIMKRKQEIWDQERELILMETYNHYRPFAASHGQFSFNIQEEDAKSIKELKNLVKARKAKDMRSLNDKLMSFVKYGRKIPPKDEKKNNEIYKVPKVKPMPAKGQQQLVELLEKQIEILKRQAETNERVLLVLESLEKHIGESSKS